MKTAAMTPSSTRANNVSAFRLREEESSDNNDDTWRSEEAPAMGPPTPPPTWGTDDASLLDPVTGEYLKKSLSELPDVTSVTSGSYQSTSKECSQPTTISNLVALQPCGGLQITPVPHDGGETSYHRPPGENEMQSLTITPVPPAKHNLPSTAGGMSSFSSTENEMNLPNIAKDQKAPTGQSGLENVYTSEGPQIVTRPKVSATTRVDETDQKAAMPVQKLEVVYTPERQMLIRGLLPGQKVMLLPDGNLQVLPAAQ